MVEEDLRALSPLIYNHVNPYGFFELDLEQRIPIDARTAARPAYVQAGEHTEHDSGAVPVAEKQFRAFCPPFHDSSDPETGRQDGGS